MRRIGYVALAVMALGAAVTDAIAGQVVPVPEISPTSLSAGLALLAGGALLARARWRK
jgi:hypothetical protein